MYMHMDIVGVCNLKCPSCPSGNSLGLNKVKPMSMGLFSEVLRKAISDGVSDIHLYNWTEPLINPLVGEFVKMIEGAGIACCISSNLNLSKNLEAAALANPTFFRISVSGFNQEVYAAHHVGGDIEQVKRNMLLLSALKAKHGLKTDFEVYYHRYKDNIDDEMDMRRFAEGLGFRFSTVFATFMPLEKNIELADFWGVNSLNSKILDSLFLPPSPEVLGVAKKYRSVPCPLKYDALILDSEGNVILCCSVYEQSKYALGKYTSLSLTDIFNKKRMDKNCNSICERCVDRGLHVYAAYPHLGELQEYGQKALLKSYDQFNEDQYLLLNPDVAAAVLGGAFPSGLDHYLRFGFKEGRKF